MPRKLRMRLIDLGELTADHGWFFEGAGAWSVSNPNPKPVTTRLRMYGVLIEHPQAGLILYEVGGPPNYEELWPKGVLDVFPVTTYSEEHRLDHRLQQLGYDLDQIAAIQARQDEDPSYQHVAPVPQNATA